MSTVLYAFATLRQGREGWSWRIQRCPFCSKVHSHGGGNAKEDPLTFLGHREPHCAVQPPGSYALTDRPELQGLEVDR